MVGLTGGEDVARRYHQGLRISGEDDGAFHLVSSHGDRNGYVYDPMLTQDKDEPERRYRPPTLTTDVVNVRSPNARFFRALPPASGAKKKDEFNVLLLVGGRVDCFFAPPRRRDGRQRGGHFVQGAVAWGHTQMGEEFPEFTGKMPRRFWDEDDDAGRILHVQRCGAGVLYLRRRMLNRDGEPSHLRTSIVTIRAYWLDRDPNKNDLLVLETQAFHMDAPATGGRYYDPATELFEAPFRGPLERAIALHGEYCRTPAPTREPFGIARVNRLAS